jgi:hypothetical protein
MTGHRGDRVEPADNRLARQRELLEGINPDDAGALHVLGNAGMFFQEQRLEPTPRQLRRAV